MPVVCLCTHAHSPPPAPCSPRSPREGGTSGSRPLCLPPSLPGPSPPVQSLGDGGGAGPARGHIRRPSGAAAGRCGGCEGLEGPPSHLPPQLQETHRKDPPHTACGERPLRPTGCLAAFLCDRRVGRGLLGGVCGRSALGPHPTASATRVLAGPGCLSGISLSLCVCACAWSLSPPSPPVWMPLGSGRLQGAAWPRPLGAWGLSPGPPGRRAM